MSFLVFQVRWLFNNEPIVSPDYQISSIGNTHTLYIPEVFDEDAGRFSIVAENDTGRATCSALLVVVDAAQAIPGEGSPPETPRITTGSPFKAFAPGPPVQRPVQPPPPQAFKPEMTKPVQKAPVVVPAPPKPQPPVPSPTFQEKIQKPAQPPPQPKPVEPPKPAIFRPQAPVQVQPPRQPPAPAPAPPAPIRPFQQQMDVKMEVMVPPEFIEPLKTIAAEEGTRVTFSGMVKGKPEPTIRWYKGGKPITAGADFEITYRNNRVELTIPEVFEEDAGRYVCEAENDKGRKESAAELIVKGKSVSGVTWVSFRCYSLVPALRNTTFFSVYLQFSLSSLLICCKRLFGVSYFVIHIKGSTSISKQGLTEIFRINLMMLCLTFCGPLAADNLS